MKAKAVCYKRFNIAFRCMYISTLLEEKKFNNFFVILYSKTKISHSVEVINLLNQLQIPLNLSSQLEECLKELRHRKELLINEMNTYRFNIEQEQLNKSLQMQAENNEMVKNSTCPNTSNAFSDTYSDISSCLDSNYESDNNSVQSFQSSFLNRQAETRRENSDSMKEVSPTTVKESVDKLGKFK